MQRHWSSTPSCVVAVALSVLSVTFLWGALGLLGGSHGGAHGGVDETRMSPAEFEERVQAFVQANKLEDGSVKPASPASHQGSASDGDAPSHGNAPTDVYLMAYKWGYYPQSLRLEVGTPYRLQMMSVDVTHGASILTGSGSQIVRLAPQSIQESFLEFSDPGEHLIYCSFYCGPFHEFMQGRIIVE